MAREFGPQWSDSFGKEPMKLNAIRILQHAAQQERENPEYKWNGPGVITRNAARNVMRAANIRQWPTLENTDEYREVDGLEDTETVYPWETLHTTQGYLHAPTILKYMDEGPPEMDPEYTEYDIEREYHPEIHRTENDTGWINEGHHRIIASRLLGMPNITAYTGTMYKPRRHDGNW